MKDKWQEILFFGGISVMVLLAVGVAWFGMETASDVPDCSTVSYDGDGTEEAPYEVLNVYQLQCISEQGLSANYVQVSDIDASETSAWNDGEGFEPVGKSTRSINFNGTFDGSSYNITDLTVRSGPLSYDSGVFSQVGNKGEVTNVSVVDAGIHGHIAVGGIVGYNSGTVSNSYASGSVDGDFVVGGIVGLNREEGTVEGSHSSGLVDGSHTGGLVGRNEGKIKNSYATGSVDGDEDIGSLVWNNRGIIKSSYAIGSVRGREGTGGLVGDDDGTIEDSYWDTETTGQSTSAGGTGLNTSEMTGSAATNNMGGFDFTNTWKTVPDDYPMLAWQTGGNRGTNTIGSDSNGDGERNGGTDGGTGGINGADGENAAENSSGTGGSEGLPGFTAATALLALMTVVAAGVRRETK